MDETLNNLHLPSVSIVLPFHNGKNETLNCLRSIYRLDYKKYDVIVTDDGSTDGSAVAIADNYPKTTVLHGDGDLWWSGAINMAISEALERGSRYILLLNNDDVVPADLLNILVSYAESNPRTIVGSRIYDLHHPDRLCSAGSAVDWWWRGVYDIDVNDPPDRPLNVPATSGQGVLIPAECFHEIGLMDAKNFPHYSGDVDFGFRARKAGYSCMILPKARVWNNRDTTGVSINKKASLRDLWNMFFGIRSYMNIPLKYRFYMRHWPRMYLPTIFLGLSYRYAIILLRFFYRNLIILKK